MDSTFITYKGCKGPTESATMTCYYSGSGEIHLQVKTSDEGVGSIIRLDEHTAVKFSRELRKEISLLKDIKKGGGNG